MLGVIDMEETHRMLLVLFFIHELLFSYSSVQLLCASLRPAFLEELSLAQLIFYCAAIQLCSSSHQFFI